LLHPRGLFDFVGVEPRKLPLCVIGPIAVQLDVCEERFRVQGLLSKLLAMELSVADGPHKFALLARSTKRVRIFGVVLQREPPSVQLDGLGVGSLNCLCMLRDAPVINKAVLAHRKYDLVIFHIGSNTFQAMTLGACMKQVIARHREALPGVPLLIMTPPDFLGSRSPPTTVSWLVDVCKEQRKIAEENGTRQS
jgi:hypothetical protein